MPETTKQQGLIMTITGNGKGKTTSALGMCMRAAGWNKRVRVIQFIKDRRTTGEKRFAEKVNLFEMLQTGHGASWTPGVSSTEHQDAALEAWHAAEQSLRDETLDLLVLDEINIALHSGFLSIADLIKALSARPAGMTVILTGRYAPEELIEISDLVSEIKDIKHPYRAGIKARKGIEY